MRDERRDFGRRAETLCTIMNRLVASPEGVRVADVARDDLTSDAVERVLQRLAERGFAQHMEDLWVPMPVLLASDNPAHPDLEAFVLHADEPAGEPARTTARITRGLGFEVPLPKAAH